MKSFKTRLATAVSSGALLLSIAAPSVFAADLEITGNGSGSNNTINVSSESNCTVNQTATTNVTAVVGASANTGGNSANNNTNGSVNITTGNANATASVNVTGGSNTAVNPCCCQPDCNGTGPTALIDNNGSGSNNLVKSTKKKNQTVRQRTRTNVDGLVGARARTGRNNTSGNTGGTTNIDTGKADSDASLDVQGGSNSLINP